jgi:hypothetical protein
LHGLCALINSSTLNSPFISVPGSAMMLYEKACVWKTMYFEGGHFSAKFIYYNKY